MVLLTAAVERSVLQVHDVGEGDRELAVGCRLRQVLLAGLHPTCLLGGVDRCFLGGVRLVVQGLVRTQISLGRGFAGRSGGLERSMSRCHGGFAGLVVGLGRLGGQGSGGGGVPSAAGSRCRAGCARSEGLQGLSGGLDGMLGLQDGLLERFAERALRDVYNNQQALLSETAEKERQAREHLAHLKAEQLRVVHVTMRTVQDIVNNCLNQLQLLRLDAEGHVSEESLALFDAAIQEISEKLKVLGDLEAFAEKQMEIGSFLDVATPSSARNRPPDNSESGVDRQGATIDALPARSRRGGD